jgi:hypothetical protein
MHTPQIMPGKTPWLQRNTIRLEKASDDPLPILLQVSPAVPVNPRLRFYVCLSRFRQR